MWQVESEHRCQFAQRPQFGAGARECGLTLRSSRGPPPAGRAPRSVHCPFRAAARRRPLSSNVRPHDGPAQPAVLASFRVRCVRNRVVRAPGLLPMAIDFTGRSDWLTSFVPSHSVLWTAPPSQAAPSVVAPAGPLCVARRARFRSVCHRIHRHSPPEHALFRRASEISRHTLRSSREANVGTGGAYCSQASAA
jgi:hypothetical protein